MVTNQVGVALYSVSVCLAVSEIHGGGLGEFGEHAVIIKILLLLFQCQGISDTEGEEKWFENVNAGMVCRLKTVVEQDSVEWLNDNR